MTITKINGNYYDLKNFNHPGGIEALQLSYGLDSTTLFKSHHPFTQEDKLETILEKYKIDKPENITINDSPHFDFNTEFSKDIINEAKNYFLDEASRRGVSLIEATKSTPFWNMINFLQLGTTAYTLYNFYMGETWSIIALPIMLFLNFRIAHEANHFSNVTDKNINSLLCHTSLYFQNSFLWKLQHTVGHHTFTNILNNDPDLHHFDEFNFRIHKDLTWHKSQYYQYIIILLSYFYGSTGLKFHNTIKYIMNDKFLSINYKPSTEQKIYIITEISLFLILFFIIPYYLYGFTYTATPAIIYSILFMLFTQINHIHQDNMVHSNDWYKHQVITASNFSVDNHFMFFISGGLNYQIEHHLFPTISHCHIPYLHKKIKKICDKHHVPYKAYSSYWDIFTDYFNYLFKLSKNKI